MGFDSVAIVLFYKSQCQIGTCFSAKPDIAQALNFPLEGAPTFSSHKGHFYKENVSLYWNFVKGTTAKDQGQHGNGRECCGLFQGPIAVFLNFVANLGFQYKVLFLNPKVYNSRPKSYYLDNCFSVQDNTFVSEKDYFNHCGYLQLLNGMNQLYSRKGKRNVTASALKICKRFHYPLKCTLSLLGLALSHLIISHIATKC